MQGHGESGGGKRRDNRKKIGKRDAVIGMSELMLRENRPENKKRRKYK